MSTRFQRKKGHVQIPPSSKILKADDYLAFIEAEKITQEAEQHALEMMSQAKKLFASEKKRGYQEGIEDGRMQAQEQLIEVVGRTIDYFQTVEQDMADIVMLALRKIIGEFDDTELILKIVRNALKVVRDQQGVTLRVAPKMVDTVEKKIQTEFPDKPFVSVVPDNRIQANGCVLETDIGVVDASIDNQLESIRRFVSRRFKSTVDGQQQKK